MYRHTITTAASELCLQMMADPSADSMQQSLAKQLLAFVDSVRSDGEQDPFYEDCIRHLTLDITGREI